MMTSLLSRFSRRLLLKSAVATAVMLPEGARAQPAGSEAFLLTNHAIDAITFLRGEQVEQIGIAPSPWGIALGGNGRAYISSARFLTVVDSANRAGVEQIPYLIPIETVGYGEYRSGGMGIAVTPNGKWVAVGIQMNGMNGHVELFEVESNAFVATIPVGVRPFDVVASPDSSTIYSIDHDSFTITAIDLTTQTATTIDAAPLGYGEFDKPHYAAVRNDGSLILPYSGRLLWILDPVTGEQSSWPLTSNTHQHGITLSADETTAYIVGPGPAGPSQGPPSLTVLNLATGEERIIELSRPHEQVALTGDGKTAILTGGYTYADGGWPGISWVDLETGAVTETPLSAPPLAIKRLN